MCVCLSVCVSPLWVPGGTAKPIVTEGTVITSHENESIMKMKPARGPSGKKKIIRGGGVWRREEGGRVRSEIEHSQGVSIIIYIIKRRMSQHCQFWIHDSAVERGFRRQPTRYENHSLPPLIHGLPVTKPALSTARHSLAMRAIR